MDPDTNSNPLFTSFRSVFSSQPTGDGEHNGVAAAVSGNHSENVSQLTPGTTTQQSADVEMGNAEYDNMPELQDISDSSDSGAEIESARQANEVEMQFVEQNGATAPPQPQTSSFLRTASTSSIADSSVTPARQNSNRRPRVDDDDDEERDRRHPSQRVSRASDNTASSSSATQTLPSVSLPHNQPHTHASTPTSGIFGAPQPPVQRQPSNIQRHVFHTTINLGTGAPGNNPFRLFQHLLPTPGANPLNNNNDHNPIPNVNAQNNIDTAAPETPQEPTPQTQPAQPQPGNAGPRPPPRVFGGMFSFDLGPAGLFLPIPAGAAAPPNSTQTGPDANAIPNAQPPPQPHHAQLPTHVAELLARIGAQVLGGNLAGLGYGLDNQEDPDRARKLVDGLEIVPEGLVRRLERVGGSGGGMGEEPTSGGDSGCAICWDRLLDTDGQGFGPSEETHPEGKSEENAESSSSSDAEKKQPKIVSLPCAHVFHAECLIPWFSRPRQTTCPTCRFNIDPDNLTYVSWHTRQRERRAAAATQTENAPPAEGASVPDATAEAQEHNAEAEARANDREAIFRQLSAFYGNPDGPATPPPPQPGRQEQPDDQFHAPHGITVTSIPITIPIPVAIPSTGINPDQLTQNRSGSDARTASNTPNAGGGTNAEQSRPQSGPGVAGPSPNPTPRTTGSVPPTPGDVFTPAFDPASHFLPRQPNVNQPNTNAFNLGGLDFGIPGMRADVVVTMDFFDPRGPIRHHTHGEDHPHDDAHQHVAGDRGAEGEDIPEMDDEESDGEDADFRDEMLRMFSIGRGSNFADDPFLPNRPRQTPQPGQTPPTAEQQQQPHQQQQHQQQRPHTHGPTNLGPGIHFAAGSGRSMGEAFAQLLSRMSAANPQEQQGEQQREQTPAEGDNQAAEGQFQAEGAEPQQPQQAEGPADAPPQPQARPRAFNRHFPPPTGLFANGFPAFGGAPFNGMGPHTHHAPRPKPAWSLPPAPGPTLRQRIERREREAGLRCYDVSCGLGPSDEDPFTDKVSETVSAMKQLAIKNKEENDVEVCEHRFHSACLVSAERVALRGADAVVQEGRVGVLCPVCRSTGCVTKEEWDEGVVALK